MDAVDGQMGRQLWGLFEGSGVFTGTMDSFTLVETLYEKGKYGYELLQDLRNLVDAGRLSAAEHDMICNEMAESARSQNYFYSVNSYIYVGKKV
jgi:hypothetical protein